MFRKTRKLFAITLALAVLSTGVPAYADAEPGGKLCEHHAAHDETCGYLEAEAGCTFLCEVCEPKASGIEEKSNASDLLGVSSLTGVMIASTFSGPPWAGRLVPVYNETLTVTPVGEETGDAAYQWYTTDAGNITDGADNTYAVKVSDAGTPISGETSADYVVQTTNLGQYIYCIVTLNGDSIASAAFKGVSQPALIGDLVIDYAANTISAPLEDDNDSLASADTFGQNMSSGGKLRILGEEDKVMAEATPTYGNSLLTATFNISLSELGEFNIDLGHDSYLGALRSSGGKVPTDAILPGEKSVVITLFSDGGSGGIELTGSYISSVISNVAAVYEGAKIILVMRASDNTMNLSSEIMGAVAAGDALYADIDSARLTLNKDLLTELDDKNGEIAVTAESAALPGNTNAEAKEAIGDRPVVDLSITSDSALVTEFAGEGKVTVSIPYLLAADEAADNLVIYYIKEDGTTEAITGVTYDNGFVTFHTGHFSTFAVGYTGAASPSEWNPLSFTDAYSNENFGVGFEAHAGQSHTGCLPSTLTVGTTGLTVSSYRWFLTHEDGVEMKSSQSGGSVVSQWGPKLDGGQSGTSAISGATGATLNTSALLDNAELKGKKNASYIFCEVTLSDGTKRYTPVRVIVPDTWGEDGDVVYPYQPIPSLSGVRYNGWNSDSKVPAFVGEMLEAELADIVGVDTSNPAYQWYRVAAKDVETRLCGPQEDNTNNQYAKSGAAVTAISGADSSGYKPDMTLAGKYIFCRVTAGGRTFDSPVRVVSFMTAPNFKKNSDGTFAAIVNPASQTISITLEDVTDNDPFYFDADECGNWAVNNGGIIRITYDIGQTSYTIAGGGTLSYNQDTNTITSAFSIWPPKDTGFSIVLYAPPYLLHPDATIHVNAEGVQISPPSSSVRITNRVVVMPAAPEDAAVENALALLAGAGEDVTELGMLLKGNNATLSAASVAALSETRAPNAPDAKVALTVEAPAASMKLDQTIIETMIPASGNVVVSAASASVSSHVNSTVKEQIGNRPVVELTISSNNSPVTGFGSGNATVTIPYTLAEGESAANLVIYYLKDDGTTEKITNASYSNGFVTFTTNHFSKFAIGYQVSGQSGDNSTGSNTSVVTPPATPEQPKPPVNAETRVEAKTDASGKAKATVPEKSVADAIKAAQDSAKKAGTEANGLTVTLTLTTDKAAKSIAATLPQNAVAELVKAGVNELRIESSTANLSVSLAALKQLQATGGSNITVSAQRVNASSLSRKAQAAIGKRPVFDLSIRSGSKTVSSFGGGSVSVELPYTLGANEKAGSLYGVYVDDSGKVTYLTNSSYDAITQTLRFRTTHFSTFGIGYKKDTPAFTDTAEHWAENDIDFVVARGLLNGTGATTFSPDTGITRGMFVTALGRLAGIDSTKYTTAGFTDVAANAYYAPFAAWASEKGITSGTGGTTFSPDKVITRQELAMLMQNYARAMGYTVPKTREAVDYADAVAMEASVRDAVKAMQMAGIMNGKNGNKFDPTGIATRAEAAATLRRYAELVIDIRTAQGLDVNDSGSAISYENGRLVKSASRTFNGATYTFNANGEAALPLTKGAGTYTVQKNDWLSKIAGGTHCTVAEIMALNGERIKDPNVIRAGWVLKIPQK